MWVHFSGSHCTCTDICLCIKVLLPSGTEECALKAARAAIWPKCGMPRVRHERVWHCASQRTHVSGRGVCCCDCWQHMPV